MFFILQKFDIVFSVRPPLHVNATQDPTHVLSYDSVG